MPYDKQMPDASMFESEPLILILPLDPEMIMGSLIPLFPKRSPSGTPVLSPDLKAPMLEFIPESSGKPKYAPPFRFGECVRCWEPTDRLDSIPAKEYPGERKLCPKCRRDLNII